jgi:hypothetical protein
MTAFAISSNTAASANPTSGETSSDFPMFAAWPQSTPLVPVLVAINWLAMPTPMIDPISVCELEAGRPRYQVPRFQIIAATSSANTIAKPPALPTCKINSTGSSDRIPNATAPVESSTPVKLHMPDHATAM